MSKWIPLDANGIIIYVFDNSTPPIENEMRFDLGTKVIITEKYGDTWYKGYPLLGPYQLKNKIGIFPAVCVQLESELTVDPLVSDLAQSMKEFGDLYKILMKRGDLDKADSLIETISPVLSQYHKMNNSGLNNLAKEKMRDKLSIKIAKTKMSYGTDVYVTNESGQIANHKNTPIINIFTKYQDIISDKDNQPQPQEISKTSSPILSGSSSPNPKLVNTSLRKISTTSLTSSTNLSSLMSTPLSRTSSISNLKNVESDKYINIYLDFKNIICPVGDPTTLYFSLYDSTKKFFLSEDFKIDLNASGMPLDTKLVGNSKVIFRNYDQREVTRDLVMVCRVVRYGDLKTDYKLSSGNKKKKSAEYRRLVGVSLIRLSLNKNTETEQQTSIYTSVNTKKEEESWLKILENIISFNDKEIIAVPNSTGLFTSTQIINNTVDEIVIEKKLSEPPIIQRTQYKDKKIKRNDFYVTLSSLELENNKATKIEVSAVVMDKNGNPHKSAICVGHGEKYIPEYISTVYHSPSPVLEETFCIRVPSEELGGLHILFTIKIVSSKENKCKVHSYAYFKLLGESGAIISDNSHLIKQFRMAKGKEPKALAYFNQENITSITGAFKIKTILASNQLTSVEAVHRIFNWKALTANKDPKTITGLLDRISYVDKQEVGKFFNQIMGCVMSLLDLLPYPSEEDDVNGDVCVNHRTAAGTVIGILETLLDEKLGNRFFESYQEFLTLHCKTVSAHHHFLKLFHYYIDNINPKNLKTLTSCFKSFQNLLLLMKVSSCNNKDNPDDFCKELNNLLTKFNSFCQLTDSSLFASQVAILKCIPSWVDNLMNIYTLKEVSNWVINLILSSSYSEEKKQKNIEKLNIIQVLLNSSPDSPTYFLFRNKESLSITLNPLLGHLGIYFSAKNVEEISKTIEILFFIFDQKLTSEGDYHLLHLCNHFADSFRSLEENEKLKDQLILLWGIVLEQTNLESLKKHVSNLSISEQNRFFKSNFEMFEVIDVKGFPKAFVTLRMWIFTVAVDFCKNASVILNGLEWNEERSSVHVKLIEVVKIFLESETLNLEKMQPKRKESITSMYGDLRVPLTNVFMEHVENLRKFVEGIDFLFVPENKMFSTLFCIMLRQENKEQCLEIFFCLLDDEYTKSQSFQKIEAVSMDAFGSITNEGGFNELVSFFFSQLKEKLKNLKAPETEKNGFVTGLEELLQLSKQLNTLPNDILYEDERCTAMLKLMAFLKRTDKMATYYRYLQNLSKVQEDFQNFAEAANCLRDYAQHLPWSDTNKEKSLTSAINLFEKAGCYEDGIEIYKQLQNYYLNENINLVRISSLFFSESKFVEKIMVAERYKISHFRVAYYGTGFSSSIRGEHIYRGNALQQVNEFAEQLKRKFPQAEFLQYTSPPPIEVVNSEDKMYIQLFQVRPSYNEELEGLPRSPDFYKKPERVRFFDENNHLSIFTYKQPFKKTKTDNEFRDLWTRQYLYKTEDVMPSIIRRSKIVNIIVREVSPIENAVESMVSKNRELEDMILKYAAKKPPSDVNPFTQAIQGVVQAFVNGGTKQYENVFFPPEYLKDYPEHSTFVQQLKHLLNEQDDILERSLKVYQLVCPKEFEPLRLSFEETFEKMQKEKQEKLKPETK